MRILLLSMILLVHVGCVREPLQPPRVEIGERNVADPQPAAPVKNDLDALAREIDGMSAVDSTGPDQLISLLPQAPEGFTAHAARSETVAVDEQKKNSLAERKYSREYKQLFVSIQDRARIPTLYSPFRSSSRLNICNEDGHHRGLTLECLPASERYKVATQWTELSVLVGMRSVVILQAEGMEPEFLHAFYKSMDTKALAALR